MGQEILCVLLLSFQGWTLLSLAADALARDVIAIHSSIYKALSSEEALERRKASACLSRVGRAVTGVQASEKEREADSNAIKDAVKPLLRFQPGTGGGVVEDDFKGACACMHACRECSLPHRREKMELASYRWRKRNPR